MKEKSMVAKSEKILQLKARVAKLEDQNKILYGLKNELTEIDNDLKKNNTC